MYQVFTLFFWNLRAKTWKICCFLHKSIDVDEWFRGSIYVFFFNLVTYWRTREHWMTNRVVFYNKGNKASISSSILDVSYYTFNLYNIWTFFTKNLVLLTNTCILIWYSLEYCHFVKITLSSCDLMFYVPKLWKCKHLKEKKI
jgi:hypothetical protein